MQFVNLTLQLAKVDAVTQPDKLCQKSKHVSESNILFRHGVVFLTSTKPRGYSNFLGKELQQRLVELSYGKFGGHFFQSFLISMHDWGKKKKAKKYLEWEPRDLGKSALSHMSCNRGISISLLFSVEDFTIIRNLTWFTVASVALWLFILT